MEIENHVEELASTLGVDTEEVRTDLTNLLEYDVPIEEAKRSLRRKHGDVDDGSGGAPSAVSISEITTDQASVTVTGAVLTVGKRTIQYNGDTQTITEGEFADETGTISYTAWEEFGLEPGDTITIGNAGVREWNDEPELNLGQNTTIEASDETLDIPYEIGGERSLSDLAPGDRGITVQVQVSEVESRTIDGRDGRTEILSGVLADESGRLPFTDWEPHDAITDDAAVRLEDCYISEYRGVPQLNVTEFTRVRPLDREIPIAETAPRKQIGEAVLGGGEFDVEFVGNVLAVRDGSGLVQRCPECTRVIQNGQCRSHGTVDGEDDLRVKAILDDGTGTATIVLDREQTEAVYEGTLSDALSAARDAMDKDVVTDEIATKIVGREHRVRGSLSVDEYGANMNVMAFEPVTNDPSSRARELLNRVEVDA